MEQRLNRLLAGITGTFVLVDAVWAFAGGFLVETGPYAALAGAALLCIAGSWFYGHVRREQTLSSMFAATAFLMVFPAAMCLLTYLAITIAGPRIDFLLAAIDRSVGISWPAIMSFAGDHPSLTQMLGIAYQSIVAQTLVLVLLLGWRQKAAEIYGFCLAIGFGAIVTVAVWTAFPSFGAYSVYHLPPIVSHRLNLVDGIDYGRQLTTLLKNGPGFISPTDLRGLIGFPSYHTAQALMLTWYARKLPYLRWVSLLLNGLMIAATPIHGGHHVVDIPGGMAVATVAIFAADAIVRRMQRSSSPFVAGGLQSHSEPVSA